MEEKARFKIRPGLEDEAGFGRKAGFGKRRLGLEEKAWFGREVKV